MLNTILISPYEGYPYYLKNPSLCVMPATALNQEEVLGKNAPTTITPATF
jgi:hypothetical protein